MVERARRQVCQRCTRPPTVCYCASLPATKVASQSTHVLVLQHPHEQKRRAAISSVPVLAQTLENVTVVTVQDDCDCGPGTSEELDTLLYGGGDANFDAALVLFPDHDAVPLRASMSDQRANRVLLIVIDGTWKEAKKIARRNRSHWEQAAQLWEARGASLQYICLDSKESGGETPQRSIYGDLRREPMEGCMSTLEAVAKAVVLLESKEAGQVVQDALLQAFQGMVARQEQFQMRGRDAKLAQYGGVTKQEAIEARRLKQQVDSAVATESAGVQREYIFYTTLTDFRHRRQLAQYGEAVTCTYDEARQRCVELNRERKRGQRVAMLPAEAFLQQSSAEI